MGELLLGLLSVSIASCLAFHLGVRRERGRQMRYEEANQVKKAARRGGLKLKTIKVRR